MRAGTGCTFCFRINEGESVNTEDLTVYETARGRTYKLLADCYHVPDAATHERIVALLEALQSACPAAAADVAGLKSALENKFDPDPLKVEYAKLFVGPFSIAAPPYGSVYLESPRQLMGDTTQDALRRYRAAGLEIARDFKDAPDHITVELEFMSFLIFKAIEASSNSNAEEKVHYLETQKSFFENHLGAWVLEFVDAVVKSAETAFYQNLAKTTAAFLKKDGKAISAVLASEQFRREKHAETDSR
ncbi:MAG: molecular chaperone TorD family protein [Desulfobacterales bacterium]|nr:MAG: molecular chaperone TorD family protein [Desulfobacterales bacterium]